MASPSGTSTMRLVEDSRGPANRPIAAGAVVVITALCGLFATAVGVWTLGWPRNFATSVRYGSDEHFIHVAGAFQIGIGVGLLFALIWRDAISTVLLAFLIANSIHAVNQGIDLDTSGRAGDRWLIGAVSVLVAGALFARLRQCGWVVGHVQAAADPHLVRFVAQKTVLVTTYRRNGTPVSTPVSLAVDGGRAVIRTYEKAWKTRRLRRNATLELAPCTARGAPTGPAIRAAARRLDGHDATRAARLLRRKYPLLHGVTVPLAHRLGRAKTGRTVHFELIPNPVNTER